MARMTSDDESREEPPPLGFEIFRADELDPIAGRRDRWVYVGIIGKRSVIRSGFSSWGSACRAAWAAMSGMRLADTAKAHAEDHDSPWASAPEPERYEPPTWTKPPEMRDEYTIKFGTWDAMAADLLSQVMHDAGSMRRAAKIIGLPRSTLSQRVRDYIAGGVWPR
jgi:hypothetical protein